MKSDMLIEEFLKYFAEQKSTSKNTIEAYKRDINAFEKFLDSRGIGSLTDVNSAHVASYLMDMTKEGKSSATINRKLSSVRSFYKYLVRKGLIPVNPAEDIKAPKLQRKDIEVLSIDEVDKLLSMPDDSIMGKRDKAILEVMYATGIRVTEVIELKLKDLNMRMGFVTLDGRYGKARIVPMGTIARKAMDRFLLEARDFLLKNADPGDPDSVLFPTSRGGKFSRQSICKLVTKYGKKAGLGDDLTPHILRNSIAVHMLDDDMDIGVLQELLGHEDFKAMKAYQSATKKNRIKDEYDQHHPRA
ncbi:MAG: tyrosine-type recombinase/integrase [Peptostreptococcaceae bacterium]|nr:tyrosine-type recombinase/integrase [Peptostreptococcaceae bacterium]MDY5739140.1 tyrosine-type recombinase/integrase [Anaerovoracaceae bacterium]SFE38312.1 integrase/recombinase XerD [Peptostreptococcaceae bacterium pGA-8]